MTGYGSRAYAEALRFWGEPVALPESGAWFLSRSVADSALRDASGCYPIFAAERWEGLAADLDALEGRFVSVALVADPFGDYEPAQLEDWFPDVCRPFKEHHTVDLSREPEDFVSSHHRRNVRKALEGLSVERCAEPIDALAEWSTLYDRLVDRHDITGVAAFGGDSFERQLRVPGIEAFRAVADEQTVGMLLWYVQDDVAYYHLGAHADAGYDLGSSFGLFWESIAYFRGLGLRRLNLGGGAGTTAKSNDGLSRFKRGWATDSRPAYFCGRVLDPAAYDALVRRTGTGDSDFFPAYRTGEF